MRRFSCIALELRYCTVSENVFVSCTRLNPDPDVPVAVTVDVTGVVVVVVVDDDAPPQRVKRLSPIPLAASNSIGSRLRRFFQPRKQSAAGARGTGGGRCGANLIYSEMQPILPRRGFPA
jgi:hypothetical protein